jgi:uncharacterized paraquat-inducible protein A
MEDMKAIIEGWVNLFLNRNETLAAYRLGICKTCEHIRRGDLINDVICDVCGCYLRAKTRQKVKRCPKNKW